MASRAAINLRGMPKGSRLVPLLGLLIAKPLFAQPADPAQPNQPTPSSPSGDQTAPPAQPTQPTAPPAEPPPMAMQPQPAPMASTDGDAPLQFKIGRAYITPVGFMDFTGVYRSETIGSGIGTNFGSIPYLTYGNQLSESRLSMQNSRFGFRVDAPVGDAHVMAYMEADFLGNNAANVAVTSNSNTLRSRLYWVDVEKNGLELLAGQTWSLITPGRSGISPLPSDIFYSQDIDTNYQAGLVWGRIPELRLAYHYEKLFHVALAIDNPEQYIGGSSGAPVITMPTALAALAGTQLNNGTTTLAAPSFAPDVILKVAVDPIKQVHVEVGGVERQFKLWDPNTDKTNSATGLGGFFNFNLEVAPGLHLVSNNFYSEGGGRYIEGLAPDFVVNADGSMTTITSMSTVSGLEFAHGATSIYGYYGGVYIENAATAAVAGTACTTGKSCAGYGYQGSPSSQDKTIQEATLGITQTFWKNPRFGALSVMGQYSYINRGLWYSAANEPTSVHDNMVFLNLRYTLPGESPKM